MSDLTYVKGLPELNAFLTQLPGKIQRNVLRGSLRAGAKVVLPVAQANIHNVSGELARSLKIRSDARGDKVTASVYTRVFYARMVEFGTKPHTITAKNRKGLAVGGLFFQSVDHPGIRPHPFMRPALDTSAGAALVAMATYMRNRLATKNGLETADIDIGLEERA